MFRRLMSVLPLPFVVGCFWGEVDSGAFVQVTSRNWDLYEGLLYPESRAEAWAGMYTDRPSTCPDGADDCATDERVDSGKLDLFMPYDAERTRGLLTQKGDLQITSHLRVGEAFELLSNGDFEDWDYLSDANSPFGVSGNGCGVEQEERTGVGPCLLQELRDNLSDYKDIEHDVRLVLLINLPGEDDVRSTACQDRPRSFEATDWSYPRTLRLNWNARQAGPFDENGDEDDPQFYRPANAPLAACDIEVYARLQMGVEIFSSEWYGQGEQEEFPDDPDEWQFDLGRVNDAASTMLGTVELESLSLPESQDAGAVAGRFHVRFRSQRFFGRDGTVNIEGSFDTEIRNDAEAVDEPERQIDLGPASEDE